VSCSLLALDTDHIKRFVFGTNKLKEIRGASSRLDRLNRERTTALATSREYGARTIYAYGGSALFLLDSTKAEPLGRAIQRLYHEGTGGGASITYAIEPVPFHGTPQQIMQARKLDGAVTMQQILRLLRARLKLAKDTLQMRSGLSEMVQEHHGAVLALPSCVFFYPCNSCGVHYAMRRRSDPDEPDGLFCQICTNKREEDALAKRIPQNGSSGTMPQNTLWGRILQTLQTPADLQNPLYNKPYIVPDQVSRPRDFHDLGTFTGGKGHIGLIYADANGMGVAMDEMETLEDISTFASQVDQAVFAAMGDALRCHLPARKELLPFDVLLVGGDDIVLMTPAARTLQVAATLAERFEFYLQRRHTLSVGVVLAPVAYPFELQRILAEETLTAAKKAGARKKEPGQTGPEQSHINFVVVTGNTSLGYAKVYERLHNQKSNREEYFATLRPYTLSEFQWLLTQLQLGNQKRLGRTKLHQLREAILNIDRSTAATILEALALLRNWGREERAFLKDMVRHYDRRETAFQHHQGTLFPWGLDGLRSNEKHQVYVTPLLDFIELYDFVS